MRTDILMLQRELQRNYTQWRNQWPEVVTHPSKKAATFEWWDKAAHVCADLNIAPSLLFYSCFSFRNMRPEDYSVAFTPTLFRSSGLMRRSVSNYRDFLKSGMRGLEVLHQIRSANQDIVAPNSTGELTRLVAQLTLDYFKEKVHVYLHPFRKAGVAGDPRVTDTVRFAQAKGNPFLVLMTAQSEHVRNLAAFNVATLMNLMPWLSDIWGELLPNDWAADQEFVKKLFIEEPHYHWPLDPWSTPYFVADRSIPAPNLYLYDGVADPVTDSYLLSIRDQRRKA